MFNSRFIRWIILSGSVFQLGIAALLLLSSLIVGTIGFVLLEGWTILDAFYMAVITISTVGFTEVEPLSPSGRLFTSFLIIFNIGIFAYAVSAFTSYFIEHDIFKQIHKYLIVQGIGQLREHVIICGYGRYGREICEHFDLHNIPFVVIDTSEKSIEAIRQSEQNIFYLHGDATHDGILEKAGIKRASAIISAMSEDTDNVFTVLTARQLNPSIKIISRVVQESAVRKLKLAGADHIITPEQVGGFYMATLVTNPGAIDFLSFITNEYESHIGIKEFNFENVPSNCQSKTIAELGIRHATGCNVIGYKNPKGKYMINPSPDTKLLAGSSFIVLGNETQLEKLKDYLESL